MHDEVLARAAALVGVALAGEHERALHALAVDLEDATARVLLDHGEQVAEQGALELVELDCLRRRALCGVVDPPAPALAVFGLAAPSARAPSRAFFVPVDLV